MLLPIERLRQFFATLDFAAVGAVMDEAGELVLGEVRSRLGYLCDVGLGYLTLDRQEPHALGRRSATHQPHHCARHFADQYAVRAGRAVIGLHPRDMTRIIGVMQRRKGPAIRWWSWNTIRRSCSPADRLLDVGPGPGERGGNIIFDGAPRELASTKARTAAYLLGSRAAAGPRILPSPRWGGKSAAADQPWRMSTTRPPSRSTGARNNLGHHVAVSAARVW